MKLELLKIYSEIPLPFSLNLALSSRTQTFTDPKNKCFLQIV